MIEGFIELVSEDRVVGWCFDRASPTRHVEIELLVDDAIVQVARADQSRRHLADAGIGNGDHGFTVLRSGQGSVPLFEQIVVRGRSVNGRTVILPRLNATPLRSEPVAPVRPRQRQQRMSRCILHIGMEKTGSTSLQRFIGLNRALLLQHGILAPRALAPHADQNQLNHISLATLAMDAGSESQPLRSQFGIVTAEDLAAHRRSIGESLAAEIESDGAGCHTTLLSSEHCQSRLRSRSEIERLRNFLDSFFDEIEIVLFIRPQHAVAVSAYATLLKNGAVNVPILPVSQDDDASGASSDAFYDYDALAARWERVFGIENVTIGFYSTDIIGDFLTRIGLESSRFPALPRRENVGLDRIAERLMQNVNATLAQRDYRSAHRVRELLIEALEATHGGKGARPSRHSIEAFQHRFDDSNERLRARRFPDRDRLFETDFSLYDQAANTPDTSLSDMAAAFVDVLTYISQR